MSVNQAVMLQHNRYRSVQYDIHNLSPPRHDRFPIHSLALYLATLRKPSENGPSPIHG